MSVVIGVVDVSSRGRIVGVVEEAIWSGVGGWEIRKLGVERFGVFVIGGSAEVEGEACAYFVKDEGLRYGFVD